MPEKSAIPSVKRFDPFEDAFFICSINWASERVRGSVVTM
jgi:hypothetical protein